MMMTMMEPLTGTEARVTEIFNPDGTKTVKIEIPNGDGSVTTLVEEIEEDRLVSTQDLLQKILQRNGWKINVSPESHNMDGSMSFITVSHKGVAENTADTSVLLQQQQQDVPMSAPPSKVQPPPLPVKEGGSTRHQYPNMSDETTSPIRPIEIVKLADQDLVVEIINPFFDPVVLDLRTTGEEEAQQYSNAGIKSVSVTKTRKTDKVGITVGAQQGCLFVTHIAPNGLFQSSNDVQVGDIVLSINGFSFAKYPNAKHAFGESS
jgi:hypothetical protein